MQRKTSLIGCVGLVGAGSDVVSRLRPPLRNHQAHHEGRGSVENHPNGLGIDLLFVPGKAEIFVTV